MRFCIYTDVHFSEYSSILRSNGSEYSKRLENLIKSISWAEYQADINNCDEIICLGDFFDRPDLNSRELTALKDIKWNSKPHTFIVGNHEASVKSLKYNSVTALKNNGFKIVDKPEVRRLSQINILFIPYFLDEDRKSIAEYKKEFNIEDSKKLIVMSHNDVKGIKYGMFESKSGIEVSDIENNCTLFLNGHLHNGTKFCKNGINLGNLTGQNFSEDAFLYPHNAFILDTDQNTLDSIENPFAFNFYKLVINNIKDLNTFTEIKDNSVLSIKCLDSIKDELANKLKEYSNKIVESRIMYESLASNSSDIKISDLTMDHLEKFIEFCKQRIDNSDILDFELAEVCK